MKTAENSKLFDTILKEIKKGAEPVAIVPHLAELREAAKAKGDALVVKVLRLAAEYIEANESFELADKFEEGLPDDISNLQYFIELIEDSENKYNREELQEFKAVLTNG